MENIKNEILHKYKKFDYINLNHDDTLVKILVSYVKQSFLFKTDILTPIQLGRACELEESKDGIVTKDEANWLHQNCLSDDFDGGISSYNRRIGFLTGTYWAYKNYEKIGNPKYFGSYGYRRLLEPVFLENIKQFDMILPNKLDFKIKTIKEQMKFFHGNDLYNFMMDIFNKIYPSDIEKFENYLNRTSGYFWELYIFKKNIFYEFCEWIFPLVFEYLKYKPIKLEGELRDIGFISERLTGYFCYQLEQNKQLNVLNCNLCMSEKPVMNKLMLNIIKNHARNNVSKIKG